MKAPGSAAVLVGALFFAVRARAEPPEHVEGRGRQGDASVSLGVVGQRTDTRSNLTAFVGVTVPLERFAGNGPRELDALDGLGEPASHDAGALPEEDASGTVVPALAPELFARLARDTVAAAESAGPAAGRERDLDSVGARARWSAVLPEVRVRAARSRDDSLHLQPTLEDPYRYTSVGGDGLFLEAQATFHLNRLLFADEEVALERIRVVRERAQEERAERVVARLLRWHRALSRERSLGDEPGRGRAALERVNVEVELDVLTNGWFGARVRRLGLEAPAPPPPAPPPKTPAAPASTPKTTGVRPKPLLADLDARRVSATSASPCLPTRATDSKTFCGALMR